MYEKFKTDEKQKHKEPEKKKFSQLLDEDNMEIKDLTIEDAEDAVAVMRRCAFDVTDKEVTYILSYKFSFGCYVNRMPVGIGLAWPTHYSVEERILVAGEANALYLEDPAVLLAYEGRGVRRILIQARENKARMHGLKFAITYVTQDLPKESVDEYIREGASQLEKLYLSEGYTFYKTPRGILAAKQLG